LKFLFFKNIKKKKIRHDAVFSFFIFSAAKPRPTKEQTGWSLTCIGHSPGASSAASASCRRFPLLPKRPEAPAEQLQVPRAPQRPPPAMAGQEAPLGALNLAEYAPAGARTVDCYRRIRKIGEGTYG